MNDHWFLFIDALLLYISSFVEGEALNCCFVVSDVVFCNVERGGGRSRGGVFDFQCVNYRIWWNIWSWFSSCIIDFWLGLRLGLRLWWFSWFWKLDCGLLDFIWFCICHIEVFESKINLMDFRFMVFWVLTIFMKLSLFCQIYSLSLHYFPRKDNIFQFIFGIHSDVLLIVRFFH